MKNIIFMFLLLINFCYASESDDRLNKRAGELRVVCNLKSVSETVEQILGDRATTIAPAYKETLESQYTKYWNDYNSLFHLAACTNPGIAISDLGSIDESIWSGSLSITESMKEEIMRKRKDCFNDLLPLLYIMGELGAKTYASYRLKRDMELGKI